MYRQKYSTFPLFLGAHGHDVGVYGGLLAINGAVLLCLELPAALALRRRSPLHVVATGLLLVATGYGLLIAGAGLGTAVAMMVLLTLGELLYKTPATAYVADQAPDHLQGRFHSLYAGVSVSGTVLAAPLGGVLYETAPGALWPVTAGSGMAAGVAVLWMGRWGRAVRKEKGGRPEGAPLVRDAVPAAARAGRRDVPPGT